MKDKDLVDAGEKYVRQKMKPRCGNSPVAEAFGDYIVASVRALKPDQYTIFLKQDYLKRAGA